MVTDGSPVNLETFLRYLSFLYILELDNIFSFHNKIYFRAILLMTTQKVGSGGTKSQFSGANFIFRWFQIIVNVFSCSFCSWYFLRFYICVFSGSFSSVCFNQFQFCVFQVVLVLCVSSCFTSVCFQQLQFCVFQVVLILCVSGSFSSVCFKQFQFCVFLEVLVLCVSSCFSSGCLSQIQCPVFQVVLVCCVSSSFSSIVSGSFSSVCFKLFQFCVFQVVLVLCVSGILSSVCFRQFQFCVFQVVLVLCVSGSFNPVCFRQFQFCVFQIVIVLCVLGSFSCCYMAVFGPFINLMTLLNQIPTSWQEVAGSSEPSSSSRKAKDSRHHAIYNPMLAERNVQTKTYLKGINLNYIQIAHFTLLYQSQILKAENKYETKILKQVWFGRIYVEVIMTIPFNSFLKEFLNNTSMRRHLVQRH